MGTEHHDYLLSMLQEVFGNKLCVNSAVESITLDYLWEKKYQVRSALYFTVSWGEWLPFMEIYLNKCIYFHRKSPLLSPFDLCCHFLILSSSRDPACVSAKLQRYLSYAEYSTCSSECTVSSVRVCVLRRKHTVAPAAEELVLSVIPLTLVWEINPPSFLIGYCGVVTHIYGIFSPYFDSLFVLFYIYQYRSIHGAHSYDKDVDVSGFKCKYDRLLCTLQFIQLRKSKPLTGSW